MDANLSKKTWGNFVDLHGERFYAIHNVDEMDPFFVSVVSDSDHWLFASSNGGLTAGRVSPETALFPYGPVDRISESAPHTGSKTLIRIDGVEGRPWEPFNGEHDGRFEISRNLYKNVIGNKLCFEEVNHDWALLFRYTWSFSDAYGFVRHCELKNQGEQDRNIELLDGLQNLLPAGTPRFTQTNSSNLVDAYKYTEIDAGSGLAVYSLYSAITDRAEPCEALRANTVFCAGLDAETRLLSSAQIKEFRRARPLTDELSCRGVRGAFLVHSEFTLAASADKDWRMVSNIELSQRQITELIAALADETALLQNIAESVAEGSDRLERIMAGGDGLQATAEENVSVHHYANVLFNILRGGTFDQQYTITAADFTATVAMFNSAVYARQQEFLAALPETQTLQDFLQAISAAGDPQLDRLAREYMPITFGRRHGDPSRPWNQFAIKLKDDQGKALLSYQGNWRDIFQNWEALAFSYPAFIQSMIAKFVNASTMDGYNPYRITKEGIDWEVEEPDDPWSYIGYWGDHQIIYLQKLLEFAEQHYPGSLASMLEQSLFCYANVPYRIKPFNDLLADAKNTVDYDQDLADSIESLVETLGSDAKMVLDADGAVYQVNLLEKMLVPLLAKLGNLVVDGGIWLNTQRPEWNDANNALVGQGLSMVTLYYMRRYIAFMQTLLASAGDSIELSVEVAEWLDRTAAALADLSKQIAAESIDDRVRYRSVRALGEAAGDYRARVYRQNGFSGKVSAARMQVDALLADALTAIDRTIANNRREDGLYHAYNVLDIGEETLQVSYLYPMLEGQVAVLSSGVIDPAEAVSILESLFDSAMYRQDQKTFMLYPDREQGAFLDKNLINDEIADSIPLIHRMLEQGDSRLVERDANGRLRFQAELGNAGDVALRLSQLEDEYGNLIENSRDAIFANYEAVFNHQAFTGRSGGMFGFEGLGCIYWHMVSKLLLAVEENFFTAVDANENAQTLQRLGELYYRVREGIGFNKTPQEYGAFPTDPYSHTPKHAGAQQPGMTGQAKEEVITRLAELGVRVDAGCLEIQPNLLRSQEFSGLESEFRYLGVDEQWHAVAVPEQGLAFTLCQIPVVYRLGEDSEANIKLLLRDGSLQNIDGMKLNAELSADVFSRNGSIRAIHVAIPRSTLFEV